MDKPSLKRFRNRFETHSGSGSGSCKESPPSVLLDPSTATKDVGLERAGAIPVSAETGNRLLRAYLAADERTRELFGREQARAIRADCDSSHRIANDLADDPIAKRADFERWLRAADDGTAPSSTVVGGINWTGRWQRRADWMGENARRPEGAREPYDRATDPLLDLDLREVWTDLTGETLSGSLARCPSPEHEDEWPSCAVRARLFFCNGCPASGSIIDLGALLYGLEPRGRDFFRTRERLLAELGMAA